MAKWLDRADFRVYTHNMTKCYSTMLRQATRKVSSVYDEALASLGINIAQYSLLRAIERLQPVSITELGRDAGLDRSTIGRNVRVLERAGLVDMTRGADDHREAAASLSDQGAHVLGEARPLWTNCQQEIESRLGPIKLTALQEILRSF